MSAVKKRKIEADPAPVSAVSAMSAMSAVAQRRAAGQIPSPTPAPAPPPTVKDEADDAEETPKPKTKRKRTIAAKAEKVQRVEDVEGVKQPPPLVPAQAQLQASTAADQTIVVPDYSPASTTSPPPRVPSPRSPPPPALKGPVQLSTLTPTKQNTILHPNGVVELKLRGSERILVLGSYGVRVSSGAASLYGAHIRPSDPITWVHAPHCHAVPVLRTGEQTVLELHPHPHADSLRRLERLSPLFRKLWHDVRPEGVGKRRKNATFQIVYTSEDVPKRAVIQDLVSPPEWNKAIAEITASSSKKPSSVFICGPKSSGKSTFGRLLTNKLLAAAAQLRQKTKSPSVAVLDLDPGQPEFAPAGLVSLVHCQAANLGPPFAHALADGTTTTIRRSHSIGSLTPASDPQLFAEACLDLFAHYARSLSRYPLIVNTPGWIQGTGLDLLVDLISGINPSHVVYMSEEGPAESVDSLKVASRGEFITLPSQQSEYSSRTAAHLRAMQTMSYFHSRIDNGMHAWDTSLVSAKTPWEVRYGGTNPGIAAVLSYEYQPPAKLLAEAINGTVLSLVEIENIKALRSLVHSDPDPTAMDMDMDDDNNTTTTPPAAAIPAASISHSPEGLPFLPNPTSTPLDPAHSQALGHVLIRGINAARQSLQLLTPIPVERITQARAAGHALVLVLGKLDAPSWAYTEDMYEQAFDLRVEPAEEDGAEEDAEDDGSGSSEEDEARDALRLRRAPGVDVPWVEILEGDEKRPVGSKVWRVRRDLGRGGD